MRGPSRTSVKAEGMARLKAGRWVWERSLSIDARLSCGCGWEGPRLGSAGVAAAVVRAGDAVPLGSGDSES